MGLIEHLRAPEPLQCVGTAKEQVKAIMDEYVHEAQGLSAAQAAFGELVEELAEANRVHEQLAAGMIKAKRRFVLFEGDKADRAYQEFLEAQNLRLELASGQEQAIELCDRLREDVNAARDTVTMFNRRFRCVRRRVDFLSQALREASHALSIRVTPRSAHETLRLAFVRPAERKAILLKVEASAQSYVCTDVLFCRFGDQKPSSVH